MKRHRLISLIFIIYCSAVYKYGASCAKPNKLHPNTYNDYRDFDYKVRFGRQLKEIDLNINSKELINEIRNPRGAPASSRHLRLGDAHQIANYFLTGGPLKGHAHFVRETNCESDKNGNNTTNENDINVSMKQDLNATLSDSIVGASHIPLLPPLPPATNDLNSILHPDLNTLTDVPHLLLSHDLLNSILHPRLHPHINALHSLPANLIQTAALPLNGLMHARTAFQDMLHPKGPLLGAISKASERAKARKNLKNSLKYPTGLHPPIVGSTPIGFHNNVPLSSMIHPHLPNPYPQPTGYVVRYVPHNKKTTAVSPVVGSPQQQPSNYVGNNLNGKQDLTGSTNNESEGTSESEQSTGENQNKNDNE